MRILKRLLRLLGRLLMAFMFAVCLVLGVVPIVPKRKDQFEIEIKMEKKEKEKNGLANFIQPEKNE